MKLALAAILGLLPAPQDSAEAVKKAVDYLKTTQAKDGHWGGQFSVAVTSMAGLAILASHDEPFSPELLKAISWVRSQVTDGRIPKGGHTWLHGQGFATLFLSEVYGRARLSAKKPDLDLEALKKIVESMAKAVEEAQSVSGGWYYDSAAGRDEHEGSTTVCAVQALRSAANFGIRTEESVLEKGFEYLKKTQNEDGSFQYRLGDGSHMQEGTAGGIATLALMRKLDFAVLINGANYLGKVGQETIIKNRFPYYGHFYSVIAMKHIDEEMGAAVPCAKGWRKPVFEWLLKSQEKDGHWPLMGWMVGSGGEGDRHDYSTAMGILILSVPGERVSIFKRRAPKMPE